MTKTNERFSWAAELLTVKPNNTILEIGCGAGLLAEQIANRLTSGQFTAIDKSGPMLKKAKQRNKRHIEKGLSKFYNSDFSKSQLPAQFFDSIVAFNVNFFWKNPVRELQLIRQSIKPKGKLYVFYQAPFEVTIEAADPIKQKLLENSFDIIDIQLKKLSPTSAYCIIAKPK